MFTDFWWFLVDVGGLQPKKKPQILVQFHVLASAEIARGMRFHPLQRWVKCQWSSQRFASVDWWIGRLVETDGNWLVLQVKLAGVSMAFLQICEKKRERSGAWSILEPVVISNCSGVQITQKRVSLNTTTFFSEKTSHRCWNPAAGLFVLCSPPGWSAPHFHRI